MKPEHVTWAQMTAVQRLLVGLVDLVCRRPRLVLAAAFFLCGLSLYAALTLLEYRTQRTDLVSPNKDYQKRWNQYLAEFGDDDDIVVVVKGNPADRKRMRKAINRVAQRVGRDREHFDRLFYKVDLHHLKNRALLFLPSDQIRQIQNYLQSDDMGWLLKPELGNRFWSMVSLGQIVKKAGSVASKVGAGQSLPSADAQILAQLSAISQAATASLNAAKYKNPWQSLIPPPPGQQGVEQSKLLEEPQYFFSGDGSLAFLLVRPIKEKGSFTAAAPSVAAIKAIVDDARPHFPGLEFGLTGLPVLETDEMTASEGDTHKASYFALAGVGLLFLVVYRGLRNPALTVTTLLVGTVWALGWMTLTVGHLNILSATFAVMLIGMGDYGVLWITRYEENRAAGADVRTALLRTAAGGGPSILTAATATALAFFAAMLADFQAVAELGWIAGSGVLMCALSCFTVMPALLMVVDRRSYQTEDDGHILSIARVASEKGSWLPALARHPRWVIAAGLALTAVLGAFAFRIGYDHNLLHLQAEGLDSVKWEMTLIQHTAGANWHALSSTNTPAEALDLRARFEKLDEVSRVVEVASLVPADQPRKLKQLRDIHGRLLSLPDSETVIEHSLPDVDILKKRLNVLLDRLRPPAGGRAEPVVADLCRSLSALKARLEKIPEKQAAPKLKEFEESLTRDLVRNLHMLRDVSTAAPITVDDLPSSLRERYVGKSGKWLLRVFARDCLWDHAPLRQFVDKVRSVDPQATGKPFATLHGLKALKHGFEWAGLYALLAIVLVFWADFRNLRHTLWALTPLAMGVVISLGIMGLCGLPLNPANMIAFPLILGVGAVYGVHVVHDYLVQGKTSRYLLSYIIGRAILVMALTNMISFGTLTISRHRGLAGLGFTLMLGVSCCMVTALVFLPAILRVRGSRRAARAPEAAPVEEYRVAA